MIAQPDQPLTMTVTQGSSLFIPTLRASCDAKSGSQSDSFALHLETVPQVSEKLNSVYSLKVQAIFSRPNSMRPFLNLIRQPCRTRLYNHTRDLGPMKVVSCNYCRSRTGTYIRL
jgi:hypothetical protein